MAIRREKLRAHQAAWGSLRWSEEYKIVISDYAVFDNSGGVIALGIGPDDDDEDVRLFDDGIRFIQLPSRLRGIELRDWSIQDLGYHISDLCIDPSSDIVAVLDKRQRSFIIHLLTMSAGIPHPFAVGPEIEHSMPASPAAPYLSTMMNFSETQLGLLFFHPHTNIIPSGMSELFIWNWKTGTMLLELTSLNIRSFIFLGDSRVLIGLIQDARLVLQIHDLGKQARNLLNSEVASESCVVLELPPFATDLIDIRLLSDQCLWRPNVEGVPFFCAPTERIFTIVPINAFPERASFLIVARQRELLRYKPGTFVPWNEWERSSVVLSQEQADQICRPCGVYGTKIVTNMDFDYGTVSVIDFNTRSVRRAASAPSHVFLNGERQRNSVLTQRNDAYIPMPTVRKSVLYQDISLPIPLHIDLFDMHLNVMLSEDNIIFLSSGVGEDGNRFELHLLTF